MGINDIQIYTDGSGYKGNIEATAIILKTSTALRFKLGKETRHTIFKDELVRILLALTLLEASPQADMVLITLDNQAAIQALQGNHAQPSQYLQDTLGNTQDKAQAPCKISYILLLIGIYVWHIYLCFK